MTTFAVYPAIDLRGGHVVRLAQGDPQRQTVYNHDPASVARRWADAGATWLHVVNLDGALEQADRASREAIEAIVSAVPVSIQLGGGLRTLDDVRAALDLGVDRIVLGTLAVEAPEQVSQAVRRFGPEAVAVAIDARAGQVQVRGWQATSTTRPVAMADELAGRGVRTVVYTNIARDGLQQGVDLAGTKALAEASGLAVIASGGVASLEDVRRVKEAGLAGVIIGRALYEGNFDLEAALAC